MTTPALADETAGCSAAPGPTATARLPALDALRSCVTLLVIALHAVMAYHPYAPPLGTFTRENMVWGAFPVIDPTRAPGAETFVLWCDSFFMALMFLLSGLFVGPSLARKGVNRFVRDRLVRLGMPFLGGILLVAPLAYLPAYLQRAAATPGEDYFSAWLRLGWWPSGPAWFLWVLLGFGLVAAVLQRCAPCVMQMLGSMGLWCRGRPGSAAMGFIVVAMIAYVPMATWVSPFVWFTWGPLTAQTSRVLLYATYFFLGVAWGSGCGAAAWAAADGGLARRWLVWQLAGFVVFCGFAAALITTLVGMQRGAPWPAITVLANALYAATGVTTSLALMALCARFCQRPNPLLSSLSRNAFGMYVIHYAIVTWLQFALLSQAWSGWAKLATVVVAAIGLSWAGAMLLRRLPGVARVL